MAYLSESTLGCSPYKKWLLPDPNRTEQDRNRHIHLQVQLDHPRKFCEFYPLLRSLAGVLRPWSFGGYAFSFDEKKIIWVEARMQVSLTVSFLSEALAQTDTRDSMTEILQYTARLTAGLFPSQETPARRVYKSLSEGRKIFRLLRFIPETQCLMQLDDSDYLVLRLSRTQSLLSVAFYVLDNWVYLLETVKRKSRGDVRPFKFLKNRISLLRILVSMTVTLLKVRRLHSKSNGDGVESNSSNARRDEYLRLGVRLWHEGLRLWLTLHKLHLIDLFVKVPSPSYKVDTSDRHRFDVLPGAIGLASAVTGFIRRTAL
jgi:hypothetical protein